MIKFGCSAVMGLILLTGSVSAQSSQTLKTEKEKLSYALGMDLGNQFRRQSIEIDPDIFFMAFKDAMSGGKTVLSEEEARVAIAGLQAAMQKKQAENAKLLAEKNKKEGDAFLAANKAKPGVIALPSGLQYKILQAGQGKKPSADDTVVCQYRGTLIDGTEFDSSYKRNQAASFPVKGVIKGWTEALQLMPVGSKWQLFIPPELAYGAYGYGTTIGPNATLVFEVELVSIQDKK